MSRKYKFHNPEGIYFVSYAVRNWVDALTRVAYKNIIVESLDFCCKKKGLTIYAWIIMSNHVHLVVSSEGRYTLSEIFRDAKRFSSNQICTAIKDNPKESRKEWMLKQFNTEDGWRFWGGDNHPIELWSNHVIDQKINYIHMNPVKAGWVFRPEDYVYSSAIDYAGGKGMLKIEVIL